jgi:hypothetical protein
VTRRLADDASLVVDAVAEMVNNVFGQVNSVRDRLAACFRTFGDDGVTRRDIASVQPGLRRALLEGQGLLRGAGVVLAPAQLMDAALWIDWWVIDDAGTMQPAVFEFDEHSLDYYDYTDAEWYLAARDGADRSLVGPYVDFNGLNDYIVTATTPVLVHDRFVGIAGADLSVDKIERRLVAARKALSNDRFRGEFVIVNRSDRIVASTSAHHISGSLLRTSETYRHGITGVSWSIAVVG